MSDQEFRPWRVAASRPRKLAASVWRRFLEDRIPDQSAKLSFYFLLSIFPLLYFLTTILGLALRGGRFREELYGMLGTVAPASASDLIEATLEEVTRGADGVQLSVALLGTVWAASRGMAAVIEGLNVAYEVQDYRRWWRRNLLAVGLTIAFTLSMATALPLLIYGERLAQWVGEAFGLPGAAMVAWSVAEMGLALGLIVVGFNVLYVYAPNVKNRRWHGLMPGTVVGVALWLAASYGFSLYLHFFDRYSATYGSIGAVIVLMLWLFLSGIAILVGGEVNSEIEKVGREGEAPQPKEE